MAINIALFGHGVRRTFELDETEHRDRQQGLRKIKLEFSSSDGWSKGNLIEKVINALKHDESPAMPIEMPENHRITAGFTYLGQFISHDISYNRLFTGGFRPYLRLLSMYGGGQDAMPFLYAVYPADFGPDFVGEEETDSPTDFINFKNVKLLFRRLGKERFDFKRINKTLAHVADGRNDQNLLVAQTHIAFMRFHNAVVDYLSLKNPSIPSDQLFKETRKIVQHHYQWIVLHQYLRLLVYRPQLVDELIDDDANFKLFHGNDTPELMEEFTQAAFRIGHSQVLPRYKINSSKGAIPIFSQSVSDLRGFTEKDELEFDWRRMFLFEKDPPFDAQLSGALDHVLTAPLFHLTLNDNKEISIPGIDIQRSISMISCHEVARQLYKEIGALDKLLRKENILETLNLTGKLSDEEEMLFPDNIPLWLYILLEAKILGEGKRLGPLGSHIIAEQLVWTLKKDKQSFLNEPNKDKVLLPEFNHEYFNEIRGVEYDLPDFDKLPLKAFSIQHLIKFPDYLPTYKKEFLEVAKKEMMAPDSSGGTTSSEFELISPNQIEPMIAIDKYYGTESMEYSMREYDASKNDFAQSVPNLRAVALNMPLYSTFKNSNAPNKPIRVFFSYAAINKLLHLPASDPSGSAVKGILISFGLKTLTNPTNAHFRLVASPASEKAKLPVGSTVNYAYPSESGNVNDPTPDIVGNTDAGALISKFADPAVKPQLGPGYPLFTGNTPPLSVQFNPRALMYLLHGEGFKEPVGTILPSVITFDLHLKSDLSNQFVTLGVQGTDAQGQPIYVVAPPCPPYCYDEA